METTVSAPFDPHAAAPGASAFDLAPPGERYFRHPGDVVRLVLWGIAAAVLAIVIALGTHTSDGVTADLGRVAARARVGARVAPWRSRRSWRSRCPRRW